MTVEEIIEKINAAGVKGLPWLEDEDLGFGDPVATDLNPDEHRWYIISTSVYKVGDRFVGCTGVSGLKSESMGYDDCCIDVVAYEMVAKASITYVCK